MTRLPIIIVGAGGHATVVADALSAAGESVLGFLDADHTRHGHRGGGAPVLGNDEFLRNYTPDALLLANGIGGIGKAGRDSLRQKVQERLAAQGWRFTAVVHPSAIVSSSARIGEAVQLMAGSIVQASAVIGMGCIINTGAIVEHDVSLEPWVHVAPRAVLCGGVAVGFRSHIGAGAVVRQGLKLGRDTVVGAGAVVINDFPGSGTLLGVPACPAEDTV